MLIIALVATTAAAGTLVVRVGAMVAVMVVDDNS
jgi:hypothetical protein